MILSQLVQSVPDYSLINRASLEILLELLCHSRHRSFAVTILPDKRSRLIETMGPVAVTIVNQDFVGKLLNDQAISSGAGRLSSCTIFHAASK
jgi:hypothetical protein